MKAYVYVTFPSHYVIVPSSVQVTAFIHLCVMYMTNLMFWYEQCSSTKLFSDKHYGSSILILR